MLPANSRSWLWWFDRGVIIKIFVGRSEEQTRWEEQKRQLEKEMESILQQRKAIEELQKVSLDF